MGKSCLSFIVLHTFLTIFLVVFLPWAYPIYSLIFFFSILYKICKKCYKFLITDTIERSDTLCELREWTDQPDQPKPDRTPDTLIPYPNGLIEVFGKEGIYRVFSTKKGDLGLNFHSLKEAEDVMRSYLFYLRPQRRQFRN